MDHAYLELPLRKSTKVSKRALINALNHAHFTGTYFWARVEGPTWNGDHLVKVHSGLCHNDEIICQRESGSDLNLEQARTAHLVIEDGKRAIVIPTTVSTATADTITLKLPEQGFLLSTRKARRLGAGQVLCEISQAASRMTGPLMDFSVLGFRMAMEHAKIAPALDMTSPVEVHMRTGDGEVFVGQCRILRRETVGTQDFLILQPSAQDHTAHAPLHRKRIRSPRLHLSPNPKADFTHPLSNKHLSYEIFDITASGFSLYEHVDETLLIPGLIIPQLTLLFDGSITIVCRAQVLHTRRRGERIRVGFTILDMDVNAFIQLSDIITNSIDAHASMSRLSDMDALWDLFFEAGFIYPQKYEYISRFSDTFKETYRKLYQENKDIFFFLTYQEGGRIYGHISFIRAYQRLWMMHHLTARPMHGRKRIGLEILRHVFTVYDAAYRLPSNKLDYIMFYFRPSNSFMMFFQGGFFKAMHDPQICSMDLFAYHYLSADGAQTALEPGWSLDPLADKDLLALQDFYRDRSGGLFLDALGIGQTFPDEESLEHLYARHGLLRETRLYALKYHDALKAVFIVDRSDSGVNLSELLNCIKLVVVDPEGLPWATMHAAAGMLSAAYTTTQIPVLTYPADYLKMNGINPERAYYLWIHNSRYADVYVSYMRKQIDVNPITLLIRAIQAKRARNTE